MITREIEILNNFLGDRQPFEFMDSQRNSCLLHALKECRKFTERNEITGKYEKDSTGRAYFGSWLGAIGYLSALDLMGSAFKKVTGEIIEKNKIKYAIKNFSFDLISKSEKNLKAIIGLRNSFTHDFNLLNIPDRKKNGAIDLEYQHKFSVYAKLKDKTVVTYRLDQWDGDIRNKDFSNKRDATKINLVSLGNLAETTFQRIKKGINDNSIEPKLDLLTLINKYTYVITPD